VSCPFNDSTRLRNPADVLIIFLLQTVALSTDDLAGWGGGYPSAACGKKINIEYNGVTVEAEVQGSFRFPPTSTFFNESNSSN